MWSIRKINIRTRLWLMLGVSTLCILAMLIGTLSKTYESIDNTRQLMVKQQVGTVFTLVQYYYEQQQQGLSETEAKAQAMAAIKKLRYRGVEYFWINDSAPNMIMHPINDKLDGQSLKDYKDPSGFHLFNKMVEVAHANAEGGYVPYLWPKASGGAPVPKTSFVRLFEPWDWIIGTGVYVDDVQQEFTEKGSQLVLVSMLLIIAMVVMNVFVLRSIRVPLARFTSAMNNIAKGEGDLTQRLPVAGSDELTGIASDFNTFIGQIQAVVQETQTTVTQLSSLSQEVNSICDQTSGLAQDQLQQTDLAATASNEMSLTIQEVAANAERAAESAKEAEDNAKQGMQVMQSTQQQILALASETQQSSQIIQTLQHETEKIGSVLEVIRGIAEQTNLLALNAAIEAARAGEQGRGFAVVADEVRTLASRSHQSTEEINSMISHLQQQASTAVNAMNQNAQNSEQTANTTNQALDAISGISHAVSTISEMNISIASAVEEQSAAANEISSNVVKIADSSNHISTFMGDTSQAATNLQQQISSLVRLVERFKV